MKKLLWLDDFRNPLENNWLRFSPIGMDIDVYWVKSYNEFTIWIMTNGLPDGICFDHDLADIHYNPNIIDDYEIRYLDDIEKTGYDCAKWLVNYCEKNNLRIPEYNIQSSNTVGKENIDMLLKNYKKYCE